MKASKLNLLSRQVKLKVGTSTSRMTTGMLTVLPMTLSSINLPSLKAMCLQCLSTLPWVSEELQGNIPSKLSQQWLFRLNSSTLLSKCLIQRGFIKANLVRSSHLNQLRTKINYSINYQFNNSYGHKVKVEVVINSMSLKASKWTWAPCQTQVPPQSMI